MLTKYAILIIPAVAVMYDVIDIMMIITILVFTLSVYAFVVAHMIGDTDIYKDMKNIYAELYNQQYSHSHQYTIQLPSYDRYLNNIHGEYQMRRTIKNQNKNQDIFSFTNDQIVISPCGQYYTCKNVHFDIAVPLMWALFPEPNTGPHNCIKCKEKGMFRGVFIMFCKDCADSMDNCVGYGAIGNGVECGGDHIHKSAWNSYLEYRDISCIGLPEEIEKNNNYVDKLVYDEDEYGKILQWYPASIE